MTDLPLSSIPARRKTIALAAAALFVVSLGLAFVLGGKKQVTAKTNEMDTPIGTLTNLAAVDLSAQATPGDWFDGVPEESVGRKISEPLPAGQKASSVVTGDVPASRAASSTTPKAGTGSATTPNVPTVTDATPTVVKTPSSNPPPSRDSTSPASAITVGGSSASQPPATAQPTSKGTKPDGGDVPNATASAGRMETKPEVKSTASVPQTKTSSPISTAGKSSARSGQQHKESKPVFVLPARKQPGVIAQTRTLITEEQFHRPVRAVKVAKASVPPATSNSASVESEDLVPKAIPVHVLKQEASAFAAQTDSQLRQKGTLNPSEHIRLPKRSEVENPAIWHDEDTPAVADERRPFGLVLSNEKSVFTPEGIPLRSDIPPGVSPLEKTGADKPLWKRPE